MLDKEDTFLKIITMSPLILIPILTSVVLFVLIQGYKDTTQSVLDRIENDIYEERKEALSSIITDTSNLIAYQKNVLRDELKARVKERVELAYTIAQNIYKENKTTLSEKQIQEQIKIALSPLIWNEGESFIWIVDHLGEFILAPEYLRHLEGTSIINFQDANGRYVIQEEIAIVKERREGFLWDSFTKPNGIKNKKYKQVAFVKDFEHFNCYFGSAEYLDTANKLTEKNLLTTIDYINEINSDKLGILKRNTQVVLNPNPNQEVFLSKEQKEHIIESLRSQDTFFISYDSINPKTLKLENQHTLFSNIPNSEWIIYSGFYSSDFQENLDHAYKEASDEISEYIINLIYLAVFVVIISLLFSYYVSRKLKDHFSEYKEKLSFQNTQLEKKMEESKVARDELEQLVLVFGSHVIASDSDLRGNITYASPKLCKVSGFTQEELVGKPHSVLRHPDTPSEVFHDLWNTIQKGEMWEGELKNITKDGGYYWVKSIVVPEMNSDGDIISYKSIRHDITAQKVKDEFMANISHEFRTPLNSILGFSRSMIDANDLDSKVQEQIQNINSSGQELLSIVNSILDLIEIENASFILDISECNLYTSISPVYQTIHDLALQRGLKCVSNMSEDLDDLFYTDCRRIKQVLFSLISNALKFTPNNGEIIIDAAYQDEMFIFSVKDNGIGIDENMHKKIFDKFVQVDQTTTRRYGGVGLGLTIAKNMLDAMNGTIQLESKISQGSTFTLQIPMKKMKEQSIQEKKGFYLHSLVVEDNKTNQLLLEMMLEDFEITCDFANDGLEAISMFDPQKHKIVFMDENMPNMNGLEAMKVLQKKYKEQCSPIIAVTANTMAGDKEEFLKAGMNGYVSKPIDAEELFIAIQKVL